MNFKNHTVTVNPAYYGSEVKVEQATKTQRRSRGIALLFL
jgi:hypothetical protein